MTSTSEQIQQVRTCFESKDHGLLTKIVEQASGPSGQKVLEELEIQIENLKNEASKQFDQERYSDCLKSFQFLCELEPQNRSFRDYLELSRQILAEKESSHKNTGVVSAYQVFDEADLLLKQPRGPRNNNLDNNQVTERSPLPVVSSPPESSLVKLSRVENSEVCPKPDGTSRLLKRVVRIAALVAALVLCFVILSHWTHRVIAPHLPDQPVGESNQSQVSEGEQKGLQIPETKKAEPQDQPIESPVDAAQKAPSPPETTQEDSLITEVFPVVHEHRLGSCKGQLQISSRMIRYLPFENSGDAFKHSPSDIIEIELDHKLKMRFADRTYRFSANSSESKQANQVELNRIYRKLIKFRQVTQ
jgi:hypothetical protein